MHSLSLDQELVNFFLIDRRLNILVTTDHIVPAASAQLCCCSVKAVIIHKWMGMTVGVTVFQKIFVYKTVSRRYLGWREGYSLLTSHLDHFSINKIHLLKGKQYWEMFGICSKREKDFSNKKITPYWCNRINCINTKVTVLHIT